ncbi:MAG: 2-oxo acid dehydrogenase subunit E2 [Lentisphaerae bacterium]|nr:MAG: 2-oxo acid dehydrogenase subunit E2 [Lentisphaerota bacterium]
MQKLIDSGQAKRSPSIATPQPQQTGRSSELAGERIPLNNQRRVIAERLSQSMFTAPHYALRSAAIVDELVNLRQRVNQNREDRVSLNAFIIKLTAQALVHHPMIYAAWGGDCLIVPPQIDIALAVALDDGLLTPVIRDCPHKSVTEIDSELRDLIARAREKKLAPEEFTGACFTITNLGSFDIDEFTAIINPPGSAILAIGAIRKKPWVDASGTGIAIRNVTQLTLNCDHRVIDGAVGASFLKDLKAVFEEPSLALA